MKRKIPLRVRNSRVENHDCLSQCWLPADKTGKLNRDKYITITILLMLVAGLAVPCFAERGRANRDVWSDGTGRPSRAGRQNMEFDPERVEQLLDRIAESDPEKAEQLRLLSEEDPDTFRNEIRKIGGEMLRRRQRSKAGNQMGMGGAAKGQAGMGGRFDGGARNRMKSQMGKQKEEFVEWLGENYPEKAQQLATIEKENPSVYRRELAQAGRKYGPVFRAGKRNPELATVLKEDMELKDKSSELVEQIRNADTEQDKQTIKAQLQGVLGARFDNIVKRKQLQFEEMKKRLERLQKTVAEKETALKQLQDSKDKEIQTRMNDLLEGAEKFNWN